MLRNLTSCSSPFGWAVIINVTSLPSSCRLSSSSSLSFSTFSSPTTKTLTLQIPDDSCNRATKPASMETCNAQDCPKWIAGEWSGVSANILLFFSKKKTFLFAVLLLGWTRCEHYTNAANVLLVFYSIRAQLLRDTYTQFLLSIYCKRGVHIFVPSSFLLLHNSIAM